ncbi:(2Fe-2S)-binding protein [Streptomyces sp. SDr-06]|uniref:(2Fe-2S)-binding protein n=1 Tax=Streptomyces sp. SDr-06 TaxID=2267702 RepID=UPI000DEA7B01|nr:(2Fe-2S)-binding protein [Streptomyces sp. SDr-06]RCH67389.1 (2Fe-2S)-binding protein [Streptomyces sp. SDr-06]
MATRADTSDTLLCLCARITESEVVSAIDGGAHDVLAVRDLTEASSGCGDCAADIEDLIADRTGGAPGV